MEQSIAVLLWEPVACWASGLSTDGVWRRDGPELPVEYSEAVRSSAEGRGSMLTLTLRPGWKRSPALWSMMETGDTEEAVREMAALRGEDERIGIIDTTAPAAPAGSNILDTIGQWAEEVSRRSRRVDAVIWVDGPTALHGERWPSSRRLMDLLRNSTELERRDTETYVRSTPAQLRTPLRDMMEREMGWTPFTMVERLAPLQVRHGGGSERSKTELFNRTVP